MCTVILLIRPDAAWPMLLAANRDEMIARAWEPPARHWPEQPDVIAGQDRLGKGTWMGINRHGVVAAVLNRPGSLGPMQGKRSRGDLPLLALRSRSAAEAAEVIGGLDAGEYRSFNLVLADAFGAVFLRGLGYGRADVLPLAPGLRMVTAHDPDDLASPRVARHRARFERAEAPEPPDWGDWPRLLADQGGGRAEQLNVAPVGGFGTVCASLLALPHPSPGSGCARPDTGPIWLFADGPPHAAAFRSVSLFD